MGGVTQASAGSPPATQNLTPCAMGPRLPVVSGTVLLLAVLAVAPPAGHASQASQEPAGLTLEADEIVFDDAAQTVEARGHVRLAYRGITVQADFARILVREERLEARGHVVVIDREGREMRGDTLVYNAREDVAEMAPAETIVSGVYIRAAHLRATRTLLVARESFLTTCDPGCPAYHLTASRIDFIPADRAVAYGATLWVGGRGILSLPVYVVSLRSPEETAGSFPGIGYNNVDGLWLSYRYAFFLGAPLGYASVTAGTLAQRGEVGVRLRDQPVGALPLTWSAAASAGWHREQVAGVETTRLQYEVGLQTPSLRLGPQTTWSTSWVWHEASYGTGDRLAVPRLESTISHRLGETATVRLGYRRLVPLGTSPLAVDAVDPDDVVDQLSLRYENSVPRGQTIATTFSASLVYDYLSLSPSVGASYGERLAGTYHWEVGGRYNLFTRMVTVLADVGTALGTDTYVTVQAEYNTATTLFEDLDYVLTAQIEDCFELSIKFRQVRQELWVSLGLAAFPQAQVQFQFRGP